MSWWREQEEWLKGQVGSRLNAYCGQDTATAKARVLAELERFLLENAADPDLALPEDAIDLQVDGGTINVTLRLTQDFFLGFDDDDDARFAQKLEEAIRRGLL